MSIKKISAFFALVAAILAPIAYPGVSHACSCIVPVPAPEAAAQSDAVFVATVNAIATSSIAHNLDISVDITGFFKGLEEKGDRLTLVTAGDSAACGVYFEVGKTYLVYSYQNEEDESFAVNSCSRTRAIEGPVDSDEDVIALKAAGMILNSSQPVKAAPSSGQSSGFAFVVGVGAVFAGLAAFKIRNRKA